MSGALVGLLVIAIGMLISIIIVIIIEKLLK
jgi:hypothetical protein